jgi:hypothetical protein
MRSTWLAFAAALVTALLALPALPAFSDPAPIDPKAQAHFDKGSKYFQVGMYDDAIKEFRAGYLIDPQAEFMYGIAQSERLSGDCKDAVLQYGQYLHASAGSTDPVELAKQKNAQAMIDNCAPGTGQPTPTPTPTPPTPASAPNTTQTNKTPKPPTPVTPEPTRPVHPKPPIPPPPRPVQAASAPVVTPPPAQGPAPDHWYGDKLGDGLVIGGVVAAVAGAVLWAHGDGLVSQARTSRDYQQQTNLLSSAGSYETLGVVVVAVGVGAIAGGALRFALRPSHPEAASVSAAIAPGGGFVQVGGSF